jgi:RHS repeat-associated protein
MTMQNEYLKKSFRAGAEIPLRAGPRSALFVTAMLLFCTTALAQVPTGTPPFGSFGGGPDVINLSNLNVHIVTPVLHKAGRGMAFTYDLSYDSSVWYPVTSGSTQSWQPVANWGWRGQTEVATGYASTRLVSVTYCNTGGTKNGTLLHYSNWVYHDPFGVSHPFVGTSEVLYGTCQYWAPGFTSAATDGSGYTMRAIGTTATLIGANGKNISVPVNASAGAASATDRNGNQISVDSNGNFTDTLGTIALTVAGTGSPSSPRTFTYTAPSGASAPFTMNYVSYTVQTNFGISGIGDYGATPVSLVSSVVLPDSTQYSFTYEQTPGTCTPLSGTFQNYCVTARLASVTLPTGGQITYSYSGGSNGILSDGSTATLTRTTPDGTWTYARVPGTGAASTTTITDPQGNQTIIQFQGIYETQRQVYQGSSTAGTLLQTVNTCYNGSASPCTGTAVSLPITQRAIIIQLGSAGPQGEHVYFYNSLGLLTEQDDYDYGAAGPGPLLRKKLVTYAALGNNIASAQQIVTIQDGLGNTVAQTTTNYDETAVTATTGTPQHVAVSGSRGNPTTIKSLVQGTILLTNTASYYDTGTPNVVTDVNGAQTTFNYGTGSCGNSFPTSVSEPLSMSRSMTWNCTGGVITQVTDENGQSTMTAYADVYFWRPASVTDPTGAVTSLFYVSATQTETALTFNRSNSTADTIVTLDGLGRPVLDQARQAPGSSNFDSTETDYDNLGRARRITLPYSGAAGQTNPAAPARTTTYDALSRPLQVADGGGGTTSYSYAQKDVLITLGPAPAGENIKRRQLEYDSLGRLTSVCELTGAAGSGTCGQASSQTGYWTKYTYDALGNLTSVTQNAQAPAGQQQTRSFSYDGLGRLTSETNPEPGTTNYTYDADATCGTSSGDLVMRVDALGNVTCYAYDALHRRTSITYPSGTYAANTPAKTFVYDSATVNGVAMANAKNRLAEAYTGSLTAKITDLGFSYSARGEVADVYQFTANSGGCYHVNAQYWANGVPSQLSGLAGLPTINYGLEGEGRPNSVTASTGQNPVASTTYNVASQPTQVNLGSSDSDALTFDPNTGRMTQYKFNVNGQAVVGNLAWNPNGTLQQLSITDPFDAGNNQTCNYSYDDLMRLTSANCGSVWAQTFSYDPFGNIAKSGSMSFQPTYSPSTNRMTSLPGFTPSYDANGNVLNDSFHIYSWDAEGRPVTIDGVGLTYDALGRMVEQNRSGVYTQIVYAPTGGKLALMNGQTLQNAFVPEPGNGKAVYNASGLSYYRHPDWLGSSRFASTPTRTMYSDVAYAPFGEAYAQAGTTDLSFTGQNQDTVGALYDFPAREYSIQGRWPSPDPAGLNAANPTNPQSWNRYAYVLNNALAVIDPLGLDCVYLNNSGDGVESVDQFSTVDECQSTGGFWADGRVVGVGVDPNSNNVSLLSFQNGQFGWTQAGAFTPGGQTWSSFTQWASPVPSNGLSPSQIAGLQALAQAGQLAGQAVDPRTIALWYGGSAALGALGVGAGAIYSGLQSVAGWSLANAYSLTEFLSGLGTPYVPTTGAGALGYAGSYLWSCHTPGKTCH